MHPFWKCGNRSYVVRMYISYIPGGSPQRNGEMSLEQHTTAPSISPETTERKVMTNDLLTIYCRHRVVMPVLGIQEIAGSHVRTRHGGPSGGIHQQQQ